MERKFYTDNFEQLLKEKSDEFRMYPSKRVWHSIYNDLHPGRKWPSIAASMLLIIALLLIGYWNNDVSKPSSTPTTVIATQKNIKNGSAISQADAARNIAEEETLKQSTVANSFKSLQQESTTSQNTPPLVNTTHSKKLIRIGAATAPQSQFDKNEVNTAKEVAALSENIAKAIVNAAINSAPKNEAQDLAATSNKDEVISTITAEPLPVNANQNITTIITIDITANTTSTNKDSESAVKTNASADKKIMSTEDKSWIEDYAFHNKSKRKKWQDRTALEFYITPNIGYRKLSNDAKYNLAATSSSFTSNAGGGDANKSVSQDPGLGLETGMGITYSIAKNIRVKAGVQANYTNYGVNASETNHPILTTLMFTDPTLGFPYMQSSSSTLANATGSEPAKVHNKTYQLSIPLGVSLKLFGNNKLEWYAGATIQPTFVFGGKAYLISADRKNYVSVPDLISKWNINTGIESYINYKLNGITLQVGPQFRYQLFSTYDKKYTVNENLYNVGIKLGILKNF
ncbi:hypothetical protein [Ferruginibacter sp.]|nr:hypothetical protein [Ferruginibacter sp.]